MSKELSRCNEQGIVEQKPEIVHETTRVNKNSVSNDFEVHNFVFYSSRDKNVSEKTALAVCRVANAYSLEHDGAFLIDSSYNNGRFCKWQIIVSGDKYFIEKFVKEASKLSSELVYNYLQVGGNWIPVLSGGG